MLAIAQRLTLFLMLSLSLSLWIPMMPFWSCQAFVVVVISNNMPPIMTRMKIGGLRYRTTTTTTTATTSTTRNYANNVLVQPITKIAWTKTKTTTTSTLFLAAGNVPSPSQDGQPDDDDNDREDSKIDPEGANLAAQLFQMAKTKGVTLEDDDLMIDDDDEEEEEGDDEDDGPLDISDRTVSRTREPSSDDDDEDDDDDDDDDDPEPNIPQGAINAFLGYDTGDVGEKLAGNVDLTDDQLYSEVKERVLDTAGGFVDYVRGASEDDDDYDDDDDDDGNSTPTKQYQPPTKVPDPELTAGEVVLLVLEALQNNDTPEINQGVEILFGYSSSGSQIKNEEGLTPAEYAEFLKETEYKVLFEHQSATIDKGDYSFDGKKGFFTARLQTGPHPLDTCSVNFILTTEGNNEEDSAWLIDSILIRPESMRRRRRR